MSPRMTDLRKSLFGLSAVVLAIGLAAPAVGAGTLGAKNPGVFPITDAPYGQTYGEWAAAWWQWALAQVVPPMLDETGEQCGDGQSGPVWFLAGTFGGHAERSCTVPADKAIFFPIMNTLWWPEAGETVEEVRALAAADMDAVTKLSCTIDDKDLKDLFSYRAQDPYADGFCVTFPEGNVLGFPAGDLCTVVTDGYWIMLRPLSPGQHTIRFKGRSGPPSAGGFELDVIYHLTVE